MKKFVVLIISLALSMASVLPVLANNETVNVYENRKLIKSVVFAIGINEYFVNGITPGTKMDARPYIKDGRTFVPVRYLGNALGVTDDSITWNGSQNKAALRLGQNTVEMIIGVQRITINGQNKDIDVSPTLNETEGRTYLPARYIAEGLGYEVGWDEAAQTVLCWPKGTLKPDVSAVQQRVRELAGKPEVVKELDSLLGLVTKPSGSYWRYEPTREETFNNKDHSYFALRYDTENGLIGADVRWATILPDISKVELDLSPIERVLKWKFPDQPEKVQEMMGYAKQVAEKTRSSNRTERAPWKEYYVDGYKVSVGSVGFNFVGIIISKD